MSISDITISSLQADFLSYLQAQSNAGVPINAYAPNSSWSILSGSYAASLLDLYMNLWLVERMIYPQYSSGDAVDKWLYSRGLTARKTATYGSINCLLVDIDDYPITIPANTIFTDIGNTDENIAVTGNQYQTLQDWTINSSIEEITLYATSTGASIMEEVNAQLQSTINNVVYTVQVQSCTIGQNLESDNSCITRVLTSEREPSKGATAGDYFDYALAADSNVTWAIVIPDFTTSNNVGILGVFAMVGSAMTDYQLDQGILNGTSFIGYTREAGTDIIETVDTYIQNKRLIGANCEVSTVKTYTISSIIINVALISGYSLTSNITISSQDANGDSSDITITIEDLIKRELRRAICEQPYGAYTKQDSTTINARYIITDTLGTLVYNQIGLNGQIAQVVSNITFNVQNISVPAQNYNANYIYYIYDVASYDAILVNTISYL